MRSALAIVLALAVALCWSALVALAILAGTYAAHKRQPAPKRRRTAESFKGSL